ncbi:histidine kinase [Streptomyces longispororuber]|uniref:sensor histidine kinase n=1 Tax=Streptomyces longispororuber TaxID=68230 RepID=UPI0033DF800A
MGRGPTGGGPGAADVAVPALLVAGHVTAVVLGGVLDGFAGGAGSAGGAGGGGGGSAVQSAAGCLVVLLTAVALVWRRTAPAPVCCAALCADAATRALLPQSVPTAALPVAVWVALYSLSVHRPVRVALPVAALATAATPLPGPGGDLAGPLLDDLVAGALLHAAVVLAGRLWAHRKDRRARALARLADVAGERRVAAAAERERLARDLHDTAGHHFTALAVQGAAARRLLDTHPELADEALAAGVAVGRDVLATLGAMVAAVADVGDVRDGGVGRDGGDGGTGRAEGTAGAEGAAGTEGAAGDAALYDLLPSLCAGLERLGTPVSLDLRGRPRALPPDVRVTAYRVVQESLTNAMRYAPGAPVTVRVRRNEAELTVTVSNAPAPRPAGGATAWGSGRGLGHLRERVAALGGGLTAGPGECGGWTVAASLPAPVRRSGRGWWRAAWWPRAVDVAAFTACAAGPLLATAAGPFAAAARDGTQLALLACLVTAHAAPLLLRRRAPATALAVLLAVSLAWTAATAAGVLGFTWLTALALAWPGELIALHAVGAYGPARATWPAPVAVGVVGGAALGLAAVGDPAEAAGPGTVAVTAALGLAAVPWLLPVWGLGLLARARRGEDGPWERRVLDAVAVRVGDAVSGERRRVATALHGTVVGHTVRLVRSAEAGLAGTADRGSALAEMTTAARGALAGLRDLLDALDAHPPAPGLGGPEPVRLPPDDVR